MVAALDPLRELDLLRRGQQVDAADVLQEELQRVGGELDLERLDLLVVELLPGLARKLLVELLVIVELRILELFLEIGGARLLLTHSQAPSRRASTSTWGFLTVGSDGAYEPVEPLEAMPSRNCFAALPTSVLGPSSTVFSNCVIAS